MDVTLEDHGEDPQSKADYKRHNIQQNIDEAALETEPEMWMDVKVAAKKKRYHRTVYSADAPLWVEEGGKPPKEKEIPQMWVDVNVVNHERGVTFLQLDDDVVDTHRREARRSATPRIKQAEDFSGYDAYKCNVEGYESPAVGLHVRNSSPVLLELNREQRQLQDRQQMKVKEIRTRLSSVVPASSEMWMDVNMVEKQKDHFAVNRVYMPDTAVEDMRATRNAIEKRMEERSANSDKPVVFADIQIIKKEKNVDPVSVELNREHQRAEDHKQIKVKEVRTRLSSVVPASSEMWMDVNMVEKQKDHFAVNRVYMPDTAVEDMRATRNAIEKRMEERSANSDKPVVFADIQIIKKEKNVDPVLLEFNERYQKQHATRTGMLSEARASTLQTTYSSDVWLSITSAPTRNHDSRLLLISQPSEPDAAPAAKMIGNLEACQSRIALLLPMTPFSLYNGKAVIAELTFAMTASQASSTEEVMLGGKVTVSVALGQVKGQSEIVIDPFVCPLLSSEDKDNLAFAGTLPELQLGFMSATVGVAVSLKLHLSGQPAPSDLQIGMLITLKTGFDLSTLPGVKESNKADEIAELPTLTNTIIRVANFDGAIPIPGHIIPGSSINQIPNPIHIPGH